MKDKKIKIVDSSRRNNRQKNLMTARSQLQNIQYALNCSAIVAITDHIGNIIHVNDKFCEISKYTREELIGKNHRIINSGYHSHEFFSVLWKTISHGSSWTGEIKNRAKDGSYYWVNTTIIPVRMHSSKFYQYISIRYEITQRKLDEEKLKFYANKLEQSNRELRDFASIAAHDLQEPLRKIQAFGDRLSVRYRKDLSDEAQDFLDRMLSSTKRMRRLIDDLLTYSRVAMHIQSFESISLEQVVQDVLSDLELCVEQTKAQISTSNLPIVNADPSQMHQLFQNLIGNALKFCRPHMTPIIQISAIQSQDECLLLITDNGIGFDEKYLDRIFTIFQRLHGREEYEGTGVGLAVCRRIVERHGGSITAKSIPGQGAQFLVSLPLKTVPQ
jgi:PAS domain S-box-containing protein